MMELPGAEEGWLLEVESFGKGGQFETAPWHTYAVDGGNRDYPVQVFEYYSHHFKSCMTEIYLPI